MTGAPVFLEPFHILGSGSLGLLCATALRSAFPSYPLAALFREGHRQHIPSDDNEITVCLRQFKQRPRMAHVPVQFTDELDRKKIRNLILSTKAFQAVEATESILPRLDKDQLRIVVLCNAGLDVRERLLDSLSKNGIQNPHLIMGTTTNGVYQEPPDEDMFHLVQTGMGRTFLGSTPCPSTGDADIVPTIAQLWDRAGLNAQPIEEDQMEVLLWQKLAANCVCNPLTALYDCTNGSMQQEVSNFGSLREQVVNEVFQVGQAVDPSMEQNLKSPQVLDDFVEITIQDNLENTSSMHRHVQNQLKTEIENLNGYVVRKGRELGIDCPANEELYHRISELPIMNDIDGK
ncbi:unnamed protein product [Cylindrotheca closterium]|uniref:2-dehydropantoate 2-reductase n=1 Tax=Cylindrotheca closterium TaxID=2856 RepID=A0AAD2FQA3_9STRA|nr:unnamed protein product [Cylindrotheca closterium]